MDEQFTRQMEMEDTIRQTESRLSLWMFFSVFQRNTAKSSEPGFGHRDSSCGDGHGIRNLDEMEATKSDSCWEKSLQLTKIQVSFSSTK